MASLRDWKCFDPLKNINIFCYMSKSYVTDTTGNFETQKVMNIIKLLDVISLKDISSNFLKCCWFEQTNFKENLSRFIKRHFRL